MTRQSSLMVAAPVNRKSVPDLRALLRTMNLAPGQADPANALMPFGEFENLHFARFVVLDDLTLDDIRLYGMPRVEYPVYIAFLCDFDGDPSEFLDNAVKRAGHGLRQIFSLAEDFRDDADLRGWMQDHEFTAAANYVNWPGRTMRQVREESALREALAKERQRNPAMYNRPAAEQVRQELRRWVYRQLDDGSLKLTPPAPTPLPAKIANALHFFVVGALLLLLLVPVGLLILFRIRPLEKTDPVFAPRPTVEHASELAELEDHEFTNQFSVMGSLKPGWARLWTIQYVLFLIQWTARHVFTKGRLGRVTTIHFARWVFLDGRKRVMFASNYDGSLESYMDDFINKVGFGLNVVFSNGIAYPATRWLLLDGCNDEQTFKYVLRRHQIPTDVWYNAHPGKAAAELERNSRIRQGIEAATLSEQAAREWVQLL